MLHSLVDWLLVWYINIVNLLIFIWDLLRDWYLNDDCCADYQDYGQIYYYMFIYLYCPLVLFVTTVFHTMEIAYTRHHWVSHTLLCVISLQAMIL